MPSPYRDTQHIRSTLEMPKLVHTKEIEELCIPETEPEPAVITPRSLESSVQLQESICWTRSHRVRSEDPARFGWRQSMNAKRMNRWGERFKSRIPVLRHRVKESSVKPVSACDRAKQSPNAFARLYQDTLARKARLEKLREEFKFRQAPVKPAIRTAKDIEASCVAKLVVQKGVKPKVQAMAEKGVGKSFISQKTAAETVVMEKTSRMRRALHEPKIMANRSIQSDKSGAKPLMGLQRPRLQPNERIDASRTRETEARTARKEVGIAWKPAQRDSESSQKLSNPSKSTSRPTANREKKPIMSERMQQMAQPKKLPERSQCVAGSFTQKQPIHAVQNKRASCTPALAQSRKLAPNRADKDLPVWERLYRTGRNREKAPESKISAPTAPVKPRLNRMTRMESERQRPISSGLVRKKNDQLSTRGKAPSATARTSTNLIKTSGKAQVEPFSCSLLDSITPRSKREGSVLSTSSEEDPLLEQSKSILADYGAWAADVQVKIQGLAYLTSNIH